MSIWHILGTLVTSLVLMEVLMGKDVTTPDGTTLGTVSDIEMDFIQDKIWLIVKKQEQWNMISSEQIANLIDKVILV